MACAGIEMLRVLENWIETEGPVEVMNWTNEKGARFPISMMGSGIWAGMVDLERVGSPEGGARSLKEELERIGTLGSMPASWETGVKLGAHFELHIEQGPHLVKAEESVGAVDGVQGYKWLTVTITGRDCHTGTTAFEHRADTLYWAATLIQEVRTVCREVQRLASVGCIRAEPGSINTMPGKVTMSLDIRHREDAKVDAILTSVKKYMMAIETTREQVGHRESRCKYKRTSAAKLSNSILLLLIVSGALQRVSWGCKRGKYGG
jgi:hydantoinase/carbamoylase family amidase